jgi:hypothetical protein
MSKKGMIIQVRGLGVPVQSPSDRNQDGYELRWSSDPEVPESAPAHVLIGQDELHRFVKLAVDPRFLEAKMLSLTPVEVPEGVNAMSRADTVAAGVNPDNWDVVRFAFVIGGNTSHGPVLDTIEWVGTREEYAEGGHMNEAFEHARNRDIKNPTITPHTERSGLMQAAHFINEFIRQMKPSLRVADMLAKHLEEAICNSDFTGINADRAHHFLFEIQNAFQQRREHLRHEMVENGIVEAPVEPVATHNLHETKPTPKPYSGPRFN